MNDFQQKGSLFAPDLSLGAEPPRMHCLMSHSKRRSNKSNADLNMDLLLRMRLAVSLTSRYEMPIVAPYENRLPTDIRSINRVKDDAYFIAPHFYVCDKLIRRFFNDALKVEKRLSNHMCSIGMDFSMTVEMAYAEKVFSSYLNKLWVAWLQYMGHNVIPNVSFPYEIEEDYWLEGWPTNSVIAISSNGIIRHGNPEVWLSGVKRIISVLRPKFILFYGSTIEGVEFENYRWFANDNNRSAYGRKLVV